MNEAILKGTLVDILRANLQGFVVIRHEDRFTHGIPDISVTGNKITTWWEVKYANPDFKSKGIQDLTLLRLHLAGYANFIIYKDKKVKRVYIVPPNLITFSTADWPNYAEGFNHLWVVEEVRKLHYDNHRP